MAQQWLSFNNENDVESPVPTGRARTLANHGVNMNSLGGNRRVHKRDSTNQYVCWCFVLAILVGGIVMTIFLTRDMHRSPLAR